MNTNEKSNESSTEVKTSVVKPIAHTPGPWKVDKIHDFGVVADTGIVAEVWHGEKDEKKANARLIAAAPELLEALENLMDYPKEDLIQWASKSENVTMTFTSKQIAAAIAAINKAKSI